MIMNIKQANNILIIRFSSLGDVLLTTPVISAIKKINPTVKIDFLVKPNFKDAVLYNTHIRNLVEFNKEEKSDKLRKQLADNKYDFVVDLQNNFRSRKITSQLRIPFVRYRKPTLKKVLLVKFGVNLYKKVISIPEMYAKELSEISLENEHLQFSVPEDVNSTVSEGARNIAFCVGAKHLTKRWPIENYVQLGEKLIAEGDKIYLLGGVDDAELCSDIAKQLPEAVNFCNDNNLFQIAADMKNCNVVFCNDSGLMHLAVAVGTPVITFFGSSVREFGFAPFNAKNTILENNSLSCRPCSHIGRSDCPKKHFDCMKKNTPEIALEEYQNMVSNL